MVTLGLRQDVEELNQALDDKLTQQVEEIMEAARIEKEPVEETPPVAVTWKYSMPFAGVRYFSYD